MVSFSTHFKTLSETVDVTFEMENASAKIDKKLAKFRMSAELSLNTSVSRKGIKSN